MSIYTPFDIGGVLKSILLAEEISKISGISEGTADVLSGSQQTTTANAANVAKTRSEVAQWAQRARKHLRARLRGQIPRFKIAVEDLIRYEAGIQVREEWALENPANPWSTCSLFCSFSSKRLPSLIAEIRRIENGQSE